MISAAVEHTPHNLEVVGLIPAGFRAFSFFLLLSIFSYFLSPVECPYQVPRRGASLTVLKKQKKIPWMCCLAQNRLNSSSDQAKNNNFGHKNIKISKVSIVRKINFFRLSCFKNVQIFFDGGLSNFFPGVIDKFAKCSPAVQTKTFVAGHQKFKFCSKKLKIIWSGALTGPNFSTFEPYYGQICLARA